MKAEKRTRVEKELFETLLRITGLSREALESMMGPWKAQRFFKTRLETLQSLLNAEIEKIKIEVDRG